MKAETAAEFDDVRSESPRQIVLKLRYSERRENRIGVCRRAEICNIANYD